MGEKTEVLILIWRDLLLLFLITTIVLTVIDERREERRGTPVEIYLCVGIGRYFWTERCRLFRCVFVSRSILMWSTFFFVTSHPFPLVCFFLFKQNFNTFFSLWQLLILCKTSNCPRQTRVEINFHLFLLFYVEDALKTNRVSFLFFSLTATTTI